MRLRPVGTKLLNRLIHLDSSSSRSERMVLESGCPLAKLSTRTWRELIPEWFDSLKCLPTMCISVSWFIFLMCSLSLSTRERLVCPT